MCSPLKSDRRAGTGSLRALRRAAAGLRAVWRNEEHFRWQVAAAFGVGSAARLVGLSRIEWAVLVLTASLVLIAQTLNWVLERTLGLVVTEYHPIVRKAKDAAAGAVLLAAGAAVSVFVLTVGPRLGALDAALRGAWESNPAELVVHAVVMMAVLWISFRRYSKPGK